MVFLLNNVVISAIKFINFKAFNNYIVKLQHMNILVGPNNCGKSTIINAFRVLEVALRIARAKQPIKVTGPEGGTFGYSIPYDSLPISTENVHTDYAIIDSIIEFKLSNKNRLVLFFPSDGGCLLIPYANGRYINSVKVFKQEFPIKISIVPVLGPVEHNEIAVTEETVRKGLNTHRASRHFRNYWNYYPDGFDSFADLIKKTWPGMEITPPERVIATDSNYLIMFCLENRITRELFWSGFGFQIWCQLLTHISRCNDSTIFIVDEPEVYLHPDVQRQLLGVLREAGPDILIATHSTEIMGEADASEILLIDKTKTSAIRLKDVDGIQSAMDAVGSVQNITLTQLARNRRLLFVEGLDDFKVICRFAKKIDYQLLASGNDITPIESGGFSSWEKIRALSWGFQSALRCSLNIGTIFDRDYWCDEQLEEILTELKQCVLFAHIHHRKEIENYLLVPSVLERAIIKAIIERAKRLNIDPVEFESINQLLDDITMPFQSSIQAQYIAKRNKYFEHSRLDQATLTTETINQFNTKWNNVEKRMEIVPGKEILQKIRAEVQKKYSVTVTDHRIINEFTIEEIPKDLIELIEELEKFRNSTI
jgi:energy-coupling factor transporter ATP-binding protein EcfA2